MFADYLSLYLGKVRELPVAFYIKNTDRRNMNYCYMIECSDGSLYTGWTNNVKKRFAAHCEGRGAKYTKGRGPLKLVMVEEYDTKELAMKREYQIKHLKRKEKQKIVQLWRLNNPGLIDSFLTSNV